MRVTEKQIVFAAWYVGHLSELTEV
jgi:hypothetical protein